MIFPDGFAWGVASASYQIEGAVSEDGRGAVDLGHVLAHAGQRCSAATPATSPTTTTTAGREDLDLLAALGVDRYRFSLAWPRLQPTGRGALNEAGVDFYSRLVDGLLERGIEPWATLYHWDLPQALQDAGGWPERDTAERFAEYASRVYERLQRPRPLLDDAQRAVVLGVPRPRRRAATRPGSRTTTRRCAPPTTCCSATAWRSRRCAPRRPGSRFGLTLNLYPVDPASDDPGRRRRRAPDRRAGQPPVPRPGAARAATPTDVPPLPVQPGDEARHRRADRRARGQLLLPPACAGRRRRARRARRRGSAAATSSSSSAGCRRPRWAGRSTRRGCTTCSRRVHRDYPAIPLHVTENGAAFADEVDGGRDASPTPTASPTSTATSARRTARSPTASTCAATSCGR